MTRTLRELIAAPHPDVGPLPPAAERPAGVRVLRGVPYGVLEGSRPLELDLWLPPSPGFPRPSPSGKPVTSNCGTMPGQPCPPTK